MRRYDYARLEPVVEGFSGGPFSQPPSGGGSVPSAGGPFSQPPSSGTDSPSTNTPEKDDGGDIASICNIL